MSGLIDTSAATIAFERVNTLGPAISNAACVAADGAYTSCMSAAESMYGAYASYSSARRREPVDDIPFYTERPAEKRAELSARLRAFHGAGSIPVVIYPRPNSTVKKPKILRYIVKSNAKVSDFMHAFLRNYLKETNSSHHQYIWFQTATRDSVILAPPHRRMASFYDVYKNEDGFLYLFFDEENCFGG